MAYKEILVYGDATPATPACLDLATALAATHAAHLVALHVTPPPFVTPDIGVGMPGEFIRWQEDYERDRTEKARSAVTAAARRSGLDIEWRHVTGDVLPTAQLHSRYADLVVIGQGGIENEPTIADMLPETIVMGAGRPALIVPRVGNFAAAGGRVLVAWSRTREATRALHDALPLLQHAKQAIVMEVNPTAAEAPHIAGADIARHLARHGVKAEVSSITAGDIDVGNAILSRAADVGADLLVMGAYGHSRLREYTLGGVTHHILNHMTLPVVMSH